MACPPILFSGHAIVGGCNSPPVGVCCGRVLCAEHRTCRRCCSGERPVKVGICVRYCRQSLFACHWGHPASKGLARVEVCRIDRCKLSHWAQEWFGVRAGVLTGVIRVGQGDNRRLVLSGHKAQREGHGHWAGCAGLGHSQSVCHLNSHLWRVLLPVHQPTLWQVHHTRKYLVGERACRVQEWARGPGVSGSPCNGLSAQAPYGHPSQSF